MAAAVDTDNLFSSSDSDSDSDSDSSSDEEQQQPQSLPPKQPGEIEIILGEEPLVPKKFRITDPVINFETYAKAQSALKYGHTPTRAQRRVLQLCSNERTLREELYLPYLHDMGAPLRFEDRQKVRYKLQKDRRRIQEKLRRQKACHDEKRRLTRLYRDKVAKEILQLTEHNNSPYWKRKRQEVQDYVDPSLSVPAVEHRFILVCKACGIPGHMKTNKICPLAYSTLSDEL